MGYDRSKIMKDRWAESRLFHQYYKSKNPSSKTGVKEFFRNENPLTERLTTYEVSYQLSYRDSSGNGIQISPETFKVYVLAVNPETKTSIVNNTINAITEMRGKITGDSWSRNAKENLIKPNLRVDVDRLNEPRGMEERKEKVSRETINRVIAQSGYYAEGLDSNVKVKKMKGGKEEASFDQSLDLSHFM